MNKLTTLQKNTSLVLKAIVVLSAVVGTILSYLGGREAFMGGSTVFMYFTIQSNLAIAAVCGIGFYRILKGIEMTRTWYIIKYVFTVSITLTGMVFAFMLAPLLGADAWNIQNTLTHLVVPVVAVIDFFVVGSVMKIKKSSILYVVIPPILYVIYAGIAYINGWQFAKGANYPYFFLNWGSPAGAFGFTNELPYLGSFWWIVILLAFLMLVGYCYLIIVDFIDRNRRSKSK